MNSVRAATPEGKPAPFDTEDEKDFWMRLADRIYGIPPGESLRLISGLCSVTIRAAGEGFVHIHFYNPAVSPPVGETIDLRSSKNARLLASWGFAFAPGEEERTAWYAQPPKGIEDRVSIIPITRQQRRAHERYARKRGA